MNKKKILLFIDWYLPGFKAGGPIRSCANLVDRLKDDYDFLIVTRDADLGEKEPYKDVKSNQWNVVSGNVKIFYTPESHFTFKNIRSILLSEQYDFIYLNSFFSYRLTILPLLANRFSGSGKRVILAPRGMLGKGALSIKPVKKKIFIFFARLCGLYGNIQWHATSEDEKKDIEKYFGSAAKIKIAPNLPSQENYKHPIKEKIAGRLELVFLSRISPKKNLAAIFGYLNGIRTGGKINFDIYGPVEDIPYWNSCLEKGRTLPSNIRFSYRGVVPHHNVQDVFSRYHGFIFPTLHENYGHVILEALSAGCPVIVSDNTIWKNLETNHAGWDIPLSNPEIFIEAINRLLLMNWDEFNVWSLGAFNLAMSVVKNQEQAAKSKQLFL